MYDLATIKKISKNDNALILKYINTFISNSQADLKAIDEYWAEGMLVNVADVLHKLKTSVAYFGMSDIEQKIISTEAKIREGTDQDTIGEQISLIKNLLTDAFQALQEEISILLSSPEYG